MTDLERQIHDIWSTVLDVETIPINAEFFDVGGDSLSLLHLLDRVENRWGVTYSHSTFLMDPTIQGMARGLTGERPPESRPALFPLAERGFAPPLFLVTAGYGDLVSYRSLVHAMGPGYPAYACQPPDILPRAAALGGLLDRYQRAIREIRPKGPYHLAGYSVGGVVALHLAATLRAQGEEVALLAILDSEPSMGTHDRAIIRISRGTVASLPGKQAWLRGRIARVAQFVIEDEGFDTHVRLVQGHAPPVFDAPILLVLPRFSPLRLPPLRRRWEAVARGGFEVRVVPGDHENFIRSPRVRRVADILREVLMVSLAETPGVSGHAPNYS